MNAAARATDKGALVIKAPPWLWKFALPLVLVGGGSLAAKTWLVSEHTGDKVDTQSVTLADVADDVERIKSRVDAADRDVIRRPEYEKDRAAYEKRWDAMDEKLDLIIELQRAKDPGRRNPPR